MQKHRLGFFSLNLFIFDAKICKIVNSQTLVMTIILHFHLFSCNFILIITIRILEREFLTTGLVPFEIICIYRRDSKICHNKLSKIYLSDLLKKEFINICRLWKLNVFFPLKFQLHCTVSN